MKASTIVPFFGCLIAVTLSAVPLRGRIIDGEEIEIADASYQLSLRYGGDHICGASLISATRALTAAQCRIPTSSLHKYTVTAGSEYLYDEDATSKSSMIYAWVAHPSYVHPSTNFNIAVLWLEEEFPLSPSISYIPYAAQDEPVPVGKLARVSGWGVTVEPHNPDGIPFTFASQLHSTQVKVLSNSKCNQMMKGSRNGSSVSDQIICTGSSGQGGVCSGDEGGALVVDGILFGIVSATEGCTRPNFLATNTRVSSYADWINSVLNE